MASRPASGKTSVRKTTLDRDTLNGMHKVILGVEIDFPRAWQMGFYFRDGGMLCGLRQREGGACGVLATVQAFVVRDLLGRAVAGPVTLATREEAGDALISALSHIIWSARVGKLASVVSCASGRLPPLREASGEITCVQCSSAADVAGAVRASVGIYMRADGPGIILLLYSMMLTRGSIVHPNTTCTLHPVAPRHTSPHPNPTPPNPTQPNPLHHSTHKSQS